MGRLEADKRCSLTATHASTHLGMSTPQRHRVDWSMVANLECAGPDCLSIANGSWIAFLSRGEWDTSHFFAVNSGISEI